jgi:hypothetical protein
MNENLIVANDSSNQIANDGIETQYNDEAKSMDDGDGSGIKKSVPSYMKNKVYGISFKKKRKNKNIAQKKSRRANRK